MKFRNLFVPVLAAASFCLGANLQPKDYLFISTHRNPTQIVSDDKVAYVLTEGGVLLYDYRRQQWADNIAPGLGVNNIAYNPDKNQLLMSAAGGSLLEYNPSFRRVSNSSATMQANSATTGTTPADLNGLILEGDFAFISDASGSVVRDSYNRRAAITTARSFNYDDLWLLTAGQGIFHGSSRRKSAASAWFGLYDPSVTSVFSDGKSIWFGSSNSAGALVKTKQDLSGWRFYAAQQDYDFPNGAINDMLQWRDYLWLATGQGIVRQDMTTGKFRLYRKMQGSTDIAAYRLFVHEGRLYAGTANGVAVIDAPESDFRASELPIGIVPKGNDFCSADKDLWTATSLGLFVLTKLGWKSINDMTKQAAPEAYGSNVSTVGFHDSTLYWASPDRVYEKPRKQPGKTLLDVAGVFRMVFEGDVLYAGSPIGVRAYNLKNRLWTDFLLSDGIPGTKVQCFFVKDGVLWMGTDQGVMRINAQGYLP